MPRGPKRTVEYALIEDIGPVSAAELIDMPATQWGLVRQAITDGWRDQPQRKVALCLRCDKPLYVAVRSFRGLRLPYYMHFQGGDPNCPWFTGSTQSPDDVRAAQYRGRQPSEAHTRLCEILSWLALADETCVSADVNKYRRPEADGHGRYPDVLIRWSDGREFAVELQLSNTFQTEISDRHLHYAREGVPLLWVLSGIDFRRETDIPQSFRDVILRHRSNAFTMDRDAIAASNERRKLVLKCYRLGADGTFDGGTLAALDELTIPASGAPYLEDRLSPPLLAAAEAARQPWKTALRGRTDDRRYSDFAAPSFVEAISLTAARVPGLEKWLEGTSDGWGTFCNLIAVVFSTLSAAAGTFRNYASCQENIQGMLNSKLVREDMLPFAGIMDRLLNLSAANMLLSGSVGNHLSRALARSEGRRLSEDDTPWEAMRALVPEIFDGKIRFTLSQLDALPAWARPS